MICYFREGLKSSIKVKMEQQDQKSIDFEEMMQRIVNAEAKAGLKSSTMVQNLDICCFSGHRPSNSITSKIQTKEITAKEPRLKESKSKDTKAVRADVAEPLE